MLKDECVKYTRCILLIFCLLAMAGGVGAETLSSSVAEWDFGTIAEDGGQVSHTFELRNGGSEPVVVRYVRTTCGCTNTEFERRPIVAGGVGEITVMFDPRFRPGHFLKDIYIYSTASEDPTILKITGVVSPRVESVEERYPYTLGRDSVRISMLYVTVTPLLRGELTQSGVEYANVSSRPVDVEFRPRRDGGELSLFYDRGVAPGENVQLNVGYAVDPEGDVTTTRRDTVDIYVDGAFSGKSLFVKGVAGW